MRYLRLSVIAILVVAFSQTNAHTTFRKTIIRNNKIDESFKQLNLTNAEIDPNIGPIIEVGDDDVKPSGSVENEIVEETEEAAEAAETEPEIAANNETPEVIETSSVAPVNTDDQNPINKYCKCSESHCDCCRNFALPIVPVRGPGCARVSYLGNEKMSVQIKYGDIILASRTISGKNTKPICVGLPGGYSRFCGRVYGLSKGKEDFKACLGLELRAEEEVEASLRVSCFKFGAKGLSVTEAEPLPAIEAEKEEDDDDDLFGLGGGGSDDDYDDDADDDDTDDDDDDDDDAADDDDDDDDDDIGNEVVSDDADYGGFSFLGDLLSDSEEDTKPVAASTPVAIAAASRTEVMKDDANATPVDAAATTTKKKTKKNKKKNKNDDDDEDTLNILKSILEFFS